MHYKIMYRISWWVWENRNEYYNHPDKARIRLIKMYEKIYYNILNSSLILLKKYVR